MLTGRVLWDVLPRDDGSKIDKTFDLYVLKLITQEWLFFKVRTKKLIASTSNFDNSVIIPMLLRVT